MSKCCNKQKITKHEEAILSNGCVHTRPYPRVPTDSHRFSSLASRCIEWFDPNMEQTNREASSPSFLQEKIKTLEITWRH